MGTISSSFFINTIQDGSFQQEVWALGNSTPATPATTQSDDPPSPWSKVPLSVDANTKNCYVSVRSKTNNVWSEFSTPALYSHYGEDGRSIAIKGNFTKQDVIDAGYNPDTSAGIKSYLTDEHPNPSVNDGYLYKEDGHLWVWNANNEWQDVGQIQGPKGEDARYLIAENSNVSYLYSSTGELLSSTVALHVQFAHDGVIDNSPNASFTPSTGVTGHGVTYAYWVLDGITTTSGTVTASYTYDGVTYTTVINVTRVVGKNVYDLVVNQISIPYNSTTDSPATTTVVAQAYVTKANGTRSLVESLPSGMSLRRYTDDSSSYDTLSFSVNASWAFTSDNSEHNKYRLVLVSNSGANIEDTQDVVIVKAANGQRGDDGDDAWNLEIKPTSISVPTYARGGVRNFQDTNVYYYLYKGSTQQSVSTAYVSVSGLPDGFFYVSNSGYITISFGSIQAWVGNGTTVYTRKGIGAVSIGDVVYSSVKKAIGEVTAYGTGYIQVNGGTSVNYYASGSVTTPTFTQPTFVTINATKSSVTRSADFQLVPSVQGEMGRNIYFAGNIVEIGGTSFDVTDTQAPFVQVGTKQDGTPLCYVFDGDNGHYTFSSDPSHYYESSASSWVDGEVWVQMETNFKYLMTKAIFSDFAKLGSGIFNGDYAFSQYGTDVNGADSNLYQNFMPVNSTEYIVNSTSLVTIGEFTPVEGRTYKVRFNCSENDSGVEFVINTSVSTSGAFRYTCAGKSFDVDLTAVSSYKYYIMAHRTSGSTSRIVSAQVVDENVFNPNLWIDWFRGEIYAQLGHFVNVTVEGVMNNLIQEINSSNYAKYGRQDDLAIITQNTVKTLILDPTKVGSVIRINTKISNSVYIKQLMLPCAYCALYDDTYTNFVFDYGLGLTIDEMRQCVGKVLYILPYDATPPTQSITLLCGGYKELSYQSMLITSLYTGQQTTDDFSPLINQRTKTRVTSYTATNTGLYFYKLECKMSIFNSKECIYWEMEELSPAMTNVANYTDY